MTIAMASERTITFRGADDFALTGTLFEAGDGDPAVILFHQCTGADRRGFTTLGRKFAAAGISALTFDFRGFGDSRDERFHDFHTQMEETEAFFPGDVDAALNWLLDAKALDPSRVALLGASCGCEQAVGLAARRPGIPGLACLSGSLTDGGHETFAQVAERPFFVAYTESDGYATPASMSRLFSEANHPLSRSIVYKGRIHGVALFNHDESLEGDIVRWLHAILIQE